MSCARLKAQIGAVLLLGLVLVACAAPPVQRPDFLLRDELFGAPAERIRVEDVFALSDEMRRYARTEIASQLRANARNRGLFDALYQKGQLKLEYDSAVTRNAAQAFAARAVNCLSLVIMTAALAKELGVEFQYQAAINDAAWSRSGIQDLFQNLEALQPRIEAPVEVRAERYRRTPRPERVEGEAN